VVWLSRERWSRSPPGNLGAAATGKRTLVLYRPCSRWRTGLACVTGTGASVGAVFGGWASLAPGDFALAVNRPSSSLLARACGVRGHGVGCCGDRHRQRRWSFCRSPACGLSSPRSGLRDRSDRPRAGSLSAVSGLWLALRRQAGPLSSVMDRSRQLPSDFALLRVVLVHLWTGMADVRRPVDAPRFRRTGTARLSPSQPAASLDALRALRGSLPATQCQWSEFRRSRYSGWREFDKSLVGPISTLRSAVRRIE